MINAILSLQDKFTPVLSQIQKNTLNFSRAVQDCGKISQKLDSGFDKVFSNVKTGFLSGANLASDFLKSSLDTYKDFEQSITNAKALMGNNVSPDEFKQLQDKALEMGRKTSKTAKEAADALGYMSLASWDANEQLTGLEPILKASEASGVDLARTSDLVTDSMSAMGVNVDDLKGFLDKAAKAMSSSNTGLDQALEGFIKVGAGVRRLPNYLDDTTTAFGKLADTGKKGSEAGTILNSLFKNLTTGFGRAGKAMKSLGVSAFDSKGQFKSLKDILSEVNNKTKSLTEQEKNTYLSAIGGMYETDLITLLDSLSSGSWDELNNAVVNSEGALDDMAKTMNGTLEGAIARAKSAIDDLKINAFMSLSPHVTEAINLFSEKLPLATQKLSSGIGKYLPKVISFFTECFERVGPSVINIVNDLKDTFLPIIKDIGGYIGDSLPGVISLAEGAFKGLETAVGFVKDNIDILLPIAGGLVTAIGSFMIITQVSGAIQAFTGVMAILNASMWACPAVWIAAAVIGLGAACIIAYKKCETFRNIINGIKDKIQALIEKIKEIIEKIKKFLELIGIGKKEQKEFNDLAQASEQYKSSKWNSMTSTDNAMNKLVNSSSLAIPAFASGTNYFKGGLAQINEKGGEIVNLPSGSQIIPATKSERILNNKNREIVVQINISGNVYSDKESVNRLGNEIAHKIVNKISLA